MAKILPTSSSPTHLLAIALERHNQMSPIKLYRPYSRTLAYLVEIVAAGPNMAITLPAYMAQSSATRA